MKGGKLVQDGCWVGGGGVEGAVAVADARGLFVGGVEDVEEISLVSAMRSGGDDGCGPPAVAIRVPGASFINGTWKEGDWKKAQQFPKRHNFLLFIRLEQALRDEHGSQCLQADGERSESDQLCLTRGRPTQSISAYRNISALGVDHLDGIFF